MEATPRRRVPIANSSFYTFYTFYTFYIFYTFYTLYTKNITTLHFEDNRQQTTDYGGYSGITESRIYGIMELWNYGSYAKTTSRAEPANS